MEPKPALLWEVGVHQQVQREGLLISHKHGTTALCDWVFFVICYCTTTWRCLYLSTLKIWIPWGFPHAKCVCACLCMLCSKSNHPIGLMAAWCVRYFQHEHGVDSLQASAWHKHLIFHLSSWSVFVQRTTLWELSYHRLWVFLQTFSSPLDLSCFTFADKWGVLCTTKVSKCHGPYLCTSNTLHKHSEYDKQYSTHIQSALEEWLGHPSMFEQQRIWKHMEPPRNLTILVRHCLPSTHMRISSPSSSHVTARMIRGT